MKLLKVLGTIILGLVIIIAISGYIFLRNFDLNQYKPMIEQMAEKQLGRKLAINGDAKLGISLVPTLIVNDVELANASWASAPEMVKIGSLEVRLSLMPLLKRQVVIDNVTLINPVVNLEVSANGTPNWEFSKAQKIDPQQLQLMKDQAVATGLVDMKTADKAAEAVQENPAAAALAGFAAKDVLVENGVFNMINQQSGQNINVELVKLALSADSMDSDINAEFDVLFNGQKIKGKTTLGAINTLLQGKEPYSVVLDATAYGVNLQANGSVADAMNNPSFAVNANIHNPSGNFGAPDVKLATSVQGNLQKVNADISSLNVNGNVITGTVSADISGSVPFVKANLSSDAINVPSLMPAQKTAWLVPSLIGEAQASQMVPNDAIPYDLLSTVNGEFTVNVKSLVLTPDITANNVVLDFGVAGKVLSLYKLDMNIGGGTLETKAVVNGDMRVIQLTALGKGIVLQQLYNKLQPQAGNGKFAITEGGNTDVDINLRGQGATYRQLVDSLSGQAIVIVDKSVIRSGTLDALSGNFIMQILNTLKLNQSKVQNLDLACAVIRADFGNGIVDFPKGIAVNAKQLNLVSGGKYNLVTDGLDFTVRPYSGQIVDANIAQAISSFIKVKGTVESPKIVLDDKQAIKALIGVAATGGTAYIGSQLVLDADTAPCYTALKGTVYQSRFPGPSAVQKAGQDAYQDAGKAVDDSVDAVKSTAKASAKELKNSVKDLGNAAKSLLNSFK